MVDPKTGQATSTAPDGTVTTENLGNLGDLNGRNVNGGPGDLAACGTWANINADLPTESPGVPGRPGEASATLGDRQTIGDLGNIQRRPADRVTPGPGRPGVQPATWVTWATGRPSTTWATSGTSTRATRAEVLDRQSHRLENGDFATTFPDGGKSVFDPDTGQLTSIAPDGSEVTTEPHPRGRGDQPGRFRLLAGQRPVPQLLPGRLQPLHRPGHRHRHCHRPPGQGRDGHPRRVEHARRQQQA